MALEDKPYRLWAGDESNKVIGLQCLFWPKCEYCGTKMSFWCAKPHRFSINDGDDHPRSYAVDIELYCPACGFWEAFGVAISSDHYDYITKWGNKQPNRHYFRVEGYNRENSK
jgi:hypothetical protein